MLFQMLSPSVIAIVLAIGVAPEKALPALVAQAGENKNNAKAKEEKKIKVEFEENYVNVKGELALVGKISISSNIDSVYEEIMQEVKKRIIVVVIRDDLLKAMILNKEVEEKAELGKGINLEMVLIPAGKFIMGSPVSEKNHRKEKTEHEVTLTKPYYMGKYEVTQEQWEAVMGSNPSDTKGAKLPVTDVSSNDCQEFIKKLNSKTSGGYRLPTEAEWEYACRAGTTTAYSFGDKITPKDANLEDSNIGKPVAVGSYKPNAFGLYDMHGNVFEWCEDWYGDFPAGSATDPKGQATGENRVLRGGAFSGVTESFARSSLRIATAPSDRNNTLGFRLARTLNSGDLLKPDVKTFLLKAKQEEETKAKQIDLLKSKISKEELEYLGKDVKLEMVLIPAGKFMMGSPASEKKRQNDEIQHEVTLKKSYYMGKYEVTQEQWKEVMGKNPSSTKGAKLPVTDVSWEDSQDFIKKLNAKTSGGYRLPTEAEWEYACRAGTTTAYSYGDNLTKNDANIDGDSTKAVGGYKPNAFGLYDMHGNVWEWCEDWKADYPAGAVTDPKGPAKGEHRMLRGGSFFFDVSEARSSFRNYLSPTIRDMYRGLRLVRTADLKAAVVPTAPKPDPAEIMPATGNLLVAPFSEAKAKEAQKETAKNLQKEVEDKADLGKGMKLEMILIPAGKFVMGSPASEKGRTYDERQYEVTLTMPFYMGKYEVTQEQWEEVMGKNPSTTKGAKLPVTNVSWLDCQEFIKKLNAKTNGGYRLPTEAEWEHACRAGTKTAYSAGDSLTKSDANYYWLRLKAVGSYKPNAFGLYDMHGNVFEWCEDWYKDYPAGSVTDPKGPRTGERCVLRGGSFSDGVSTARSSNRLHSSPSVRHHFVGFRLARTADTKTAVSALTVTKPNPAVVMPSTENILVAPFSEAKTKEVQKEVAKRLQKEVEEKVDLGKGMKLDLVLIPAGKFMMGSPESEKDRYKDEIQHEVTLTKPFYMGRYEVTQEQWEAVMGNNPSSRTKGAKLPVTDVSWNDCQDFIKQLNARTNGGYRLPTEAEWEYACRAGTTTAYSFGDNLTKSNSNYDVGTAGSIKSGGSYKANIFGLYDMHGNVFEWCEDWKADYPAGTVTDPEGPAMGDHRVLRGGSVGCVVSGARSSYRGSFSPTIRDDAYGFRLARTP